MLVLQSIEGPRPLLPKRPCLLSWNTGWFAGGKKGDRWPRNQTMIMFNDFQAGYESCGWKHQDANAHLWACPGRWVQVLPLVLWEKASFEIQKKALCLECSLNMSTRSQSQSDDATSLLLRSAEAFNVPDASSRYRAFILSLPSVHVCHVEWETNLKCERTGYSQQKTPFLQLSVSSRRSICFIKA